MKYLVAKVLIKDNPRYPINENSYHLIIDLKTRQAKVICVPGEEDLISKRAVEEGNLGKLVLNGDFIQVEKNKRITEFLPFGKDKLVPIIGRLDKSTKNYAFYIEI